MREVLRRLVGAALLAVGLPAFAALEPVPPPLQMDAKDPDISRNVTKLIEELHYSRPQIDNSYSSAILDGYLDALDGNRMYFLESDVASFGRYRYEMDDRAKSGDLQPVFDIFNLFRQRTRERAEYAISLLQTEPDFTLDESFVFDRSELPWPVSQEEVNEVWRKKVKSDALSLMLTGKTWPEAAKVLTDRYENMYKRMTQLTSDDVFETFMNALAHTMDPHSSYLSPRQSEEYRIQMSLSYDGIGASLQPEDDYVKVVEVIPGGPAQIDGQLKPEDRITAVGEGKEGELVDVIGWRLDDVVQLIRGPGGTTVRLQVLPAGAAPGSPQKVIPLVRDKVKLEEQAAKSEIKEIDYQGHKYKIGVIDVPSFYQDFAARSRGDQDYTSTSRDVTRLIHELQSQGIDGLLMDLRENGGGHLSEATELSGLFIDRGPIVQLRETRGDPQVLDDPNPGLVYDGPMAVLVDRYSASASEIFAGAMQDYKRAVIIGQQTFGKGSVQNLFSLDRVMRGQNNGQLTLTIGKYYRVTGESTQHRGVIPDVELPSLVDTKTVGESTRDTALPWDRIKPTDFKAFQKLDGEIQTLRADEAQRTQTDPNLEYLLGDISALNKVNSEKAVSLNLAKRQAEREQMQDEQLARENARRATLGLEPLAGVADLDKAEAPQEILLNEATRLVAEMVADGRLGGAGKKQQLLTGGRDSTASARQPAGGLGH
ncbi:MAG TPA: carboxy terminal-processing peptidase [Gammaproteobacteria bacterium]|nr:carboxy terminal-processing peptidase [Gammaproteobacteria bacterium]